MFIFWTIFGILLGLTILSLLINRWYLDWASIMIAINIILGIVCVIYLFVALLATPNKFKEITYIKPDEIVRSKNLIFVIDSVGTVYRSDLKKYYDLTDSLVCIEEKRNVNFYNFALDTYKKIRECK